MGGNRLKVPREWNGGERQELPWAREENDQGGLAICLKLEAKGTCRLPPTTTVWPGRSPGYRRRQTAPNSDRHRSMIRNIDRWGHSNSRERDPTTSRTESQVEAMTGGWAHRAPRQTQREVVRGTQGSWDEHDAFVTQTKPWLTGFKLQSQAPYLEDPFPLGELLLILQDPAQVFPLLRSLP